MDGYAKARGPLLDRVINLARAVDKDPEHVGVLSTGERCAVALLHNKPEYLPNGYTHLLEAIDRLETSWVEACIVAHNTGWKEQ